MRAFLLTREHRETGTLTVKPRILEKKRAVGIQNTNNTSASRDSKRVAEPTKGTSQFGGGEDQGEFATTEKTKNHDGLTADSGDQRKLCLISHSGIYSYSADTGEANT